MSMVKSSYPKISLLDRLTTKPINLGLEVLREFIKVFAGHLQETKQIYY